MNRWPFPDPPETLAQTMRVILLGRPILFVEHDENGGWHFFDGRQVFGLEELTSARLEQIVEQDQSIQNVADLQKGWRAWRISRDAGWERESQQLKEKSRAKTAETLDEMRRTSPPLPPS